MSRLPVVIPTHSRPDLLARAVASCAPHPVVVVDDSPAGQPALAGTTWIRGGGEEGYARAVNRGLRWLFEQGARAAMVLNDDACLTTADIARLHETWRRTGGIVGPVVETMDGQVQSAGFDLAWWGRLRACRARPPHPTTVDAVSGACMVVGTAWRFDPRFTHGMEDIELCLRVRAAGGVVVVDPSARCRHEGGATVATDSARAQRHAVRGHLHLVGGGWRSGVVVGLAVAQVLAEGGPRDRLGGIAGGIADFRRSRSPTRSP